MSTFFHTLLALQSAQPALSVAITVASHVGDYDFGDIVPFTITVTNTGNVALSNIVVSEDATGYGTTISSLSAGASWTSSTISTLVIDEYIILSESVDIDAAASCTYRGNTVSDTDSVTVNAIASPNPSLSQPTVTITSSPANGTSYVLEEQIEYSLYFTNNGNVTIENIVIQSDLTGDYWTRQSLAPNATSSEHTASYTVTEQDIINGYVDFDLYIDGEDPNGNAITTVTRTTRSTNIAAPAPAFTVSLVETSSPQGTDYVTGETIIYSVVVTNTGNLTLTNFAIGNTIIESVLSPNDSTVGGQNLPTVSHTVTSSDVTNGSYTTSATVTAESDDPNHPTLSVTATDTVTCAEPIPDYLCFTALESGTFTFSIPAVVTSSDISYVEYSTNGTSWTRLTNSSNDETITTPTIAVNGKVYWRGSLNRFGTSDSASNCARFSSTGRFNASGDALSLMYGENFASYNDLPNYYYSFACMFYGCSKLVSAGDLLLRPTSLANRHICYTRMFQGCTSLTTPPALPATTLSNYSYRWMFNGCSSLTSAPVLAATTVPRAAYWGMFRGCTSITSAPSLPATTATDYCYQAMFYGCTSLTSTANLPATTAGDYAYQYMYYGCTSLTTAPSISATTIGTNCCESMFQACPAIVTPPSSLFATTLTTSCYLNMFRGCTSMTSVPTISATTLADNCCENMFYGCTGITTAPDLNATTLVDNCYKQMFYGCTSLNAVKCLATSISATDCTTDWLYNVASSGTFTQVRSTQWSEGASGIPVTWQPYDTSNNPIYDYLKFKATEAGTFTFKIASAVTTSQCTSISYSLDGGATWTTTNNVASTEVTITTPSVSAGGEVVWKGTGTKLGTGTSAGSSFSSTGKFTVSGNILSLFYDNNFRSKNLPSSTYAFATLFKDCATITDASEMKFPKSTTTSSSIYANMFYGCTELLHAPVLPALTLGSNAYYQMFEGCTKLVECPSLPATTLGSSCYYRMFYDCKAITSLPALNATTLANTCYRAMFYNCTGLTSIPSGYLPATTLTTTCYYEMFRGCNNLETIPSNLLPATTLQSSCYCGMFRDCAKITTAPDLPAETLVSSCYNYMFYKSSKLEYIKAMFTTEPSTSYTQNWVYQVKSTGTFVKNANATWNVTGNNGIPSGWTVQTASP